MSPRRNPRRAHFLHRFQHALIYRFDHFSVHQQQKHCFAATSPVSVYPINAPPCRALRSGRCSAKIRLRGIESSAPEFACGVWVVVDFGDDLCNAGRRGDRLTVFAWSSRLIDSVSFTPSNPRVLVSHWSVPSMLPGVVLGFVPTVRRVVACRVFGLRLAMPPLQVAASLPTVRVACRM